MHWIRNAHISAWVYGLVSVILVMQLSGCASLVAGGSAIVAAKDRRPIGAFVSDKVVVFNIAQKLKATLPNHHINVTSYNRTILLTGEVLNVSDRAQADAIARNHTEVRKVFNYIEIGPLSKFNARSSDTWITTKIYCNLLAGNGYPINQLKIVTERGIVYLMGLLNNEETNAAAQVISQTQGVQQVVLLTEINPS